MKSAAHRERARLKKQRQRVEKAETRRLAALVAAERLERDTAAMERAEESIVSGALRKSVVDRAGVMLLGPRMQVIDGRLARVDPLAMLKLTERRKRAGHQLQTDWREVGAGLGVGVVDYLRSGGAGDGEGGHAAMRRQIDTRARLDGAMAAAGAFAPFLARVVLDGVPLDVATAEDARITDGRGWLDAALDRLAGFYWPPHAGSPGERVLTFGPSRATYALANEETA